MKIRPNRILAQPATVAACQSDRGTPAEQQARQVEAVEQRGQAQANGNTAGKAWRGRRTP